MDKIKEAIISKTVIIDNEDSRSRAARYSVCQNKKYLSCSKAFKIAEQYNIELSDTGNICNNQNIKTHKCQLGCF